ncbi:MAG: hypothetical protein COX65_05920 [Elusimicrobia bacterium CG_4_10_14_0_2_um_filter_56_8]|nr:MAG: hypothetical protein AUJ51_12790 [Elusimicrobia bacterium CG1_02_56_21]PJA14255.1 MAG: hypothetical protein COX65_05920 [Elusimicrobia bacterium CG_4_10_14_0_2_um_filter_56_8]
MANITKKKACGCACGAAKEALLTPADAIMAVAILAVSSDGKLDKSEIYDLENVLIMNPLFKEVEDAGGYLSCIASAIANKGRGTVLKKAASLLSQSLRETAYAWAVHVAASDRKVVGAEHKFLSELRKELKIHGVLAGKINAVVPMLYRTK